MSRTVNVPSRIKYRTSRVKFRLQHILPFHIRIIFLIRIVKSSVIIEIFLQCVFNVRRICTTALRTIIHIYRHSAMICQCCDSILLSLRTCSIRFSDHIIPIINRVSEVDTYRSIVVFLIRMRAFTFMRPFPVFHELSHCRRYTSCHRTSRTHIHVRNILIPMCDDERRDERPLFRFRLNTIFKIIPIRLYFLRCRNVIIDNILYFIIKRIHPI